MKKFIFLCSAALLFSVTACNQNASTGKEAETMKSADKPLVIVVAQLASPKDPVCGMTLTKESVADTANNADKLYGFCSKECKESFVKNPQSYLSQN